MTIELAVLTAQFTLIVGLFAQRRRRRRAEEQARRVEERNSAMLRAIPDLMFVVRRDGTYIDYHARDRQTLFAPPDRFMGKTIRDIMPPPLADTFMDALDLACRTDETVVVEYELPMDPMDPAGNVRCYEARLVHAGEDRVLSIVRDVTEPKRATELNRDLAGRLIASQEAERQRIARELHDDVSQKIALLTVDIDRLIDRTSGEEVQSQLRKLSLDAREIVADVRNLSHELHPSRLQALGLVASVQSLCRDASRQLGIEVTFTHGSIPQALDSTVTLCLYRIVQEALHNIARHSRARQAQVQLAVESDGLLLQIADSGVGFDPKESQNDGLGFASMRERVALLRGRLAIHTFPGGGTRIGVRIPLPSVQKSA